VEREEMIGILEEIIRDPETNATARCTAIRTLREFPGQLEEHLSRRDLDLLFPDDYEPRRSGRGANHG
jgi:hypothetical protein